MIFMRMNNLDKEYWENRYKEKQTGWNIGYISTPIKTYVDQIKDKSIKILIPGAGNSYEAEYFWQNGFKNIKVLDIAKQPLENLKKRIPTFPNNQLIHGNFFNHKGSYDLIIEQTFFCALSPNLRKSYANTISDLLNPNGKIVGLLFNFELTDSGPPFGGNTNEYIKLFGSQFYINILKPSINSIKERQGKELFFIFEKKGNGVNQKYHTKSQGN